ncbi:Fkbp-type peptidyl-prolyl cis-trans isomerase [Thalictrum thalictroides]|uniref:Fkbp-type peptidyl-prolyl cis-trans isomerase n=1 Tax=Thalictrum thalictroides TaxID=46969 RepID=A0A7J6VDR6_THATH|nr:Fkbp-type peptidyl-prolyl cis-trans isomerase [Thalictrum thalictroides]
MGFSPYTERVNGKLATLGLAALLLVELATGKTVIRYHTPAIVFIQIYFVTAVSAVFVKYEKERISIWPESDVVNVKQ